MDADVATPQPVREDRGDDTSRWVVGVDGSECSRTAARWAAANAPGRASEIQLASTWSIPVTNAMSPSSPVTTRASFEALEASAHAAVDGVAGELAPMTDVALTKHVGQGGAAPLLLDVAQDGSLLVVGSRGRGGFARLLLGSTSTQCATHSAVPVVVVPADAPVDPVTSIVVGFDGSANSVAALRWACGFATPGSTIHCVTVWDTTPIPVGADQVVLPEASGLVRERLKELVLRTVRGVSVDGVDVDHTFVEGRPRSMLAEFASGSDLFVVGARGHGAIASAILGSVSTWLLHHVTRPIVVVPADAGEDRDALTATVEQGGVSNVDGGHDDGPAPAGSDDAPLAERHRPVLDFVTGEVITLATSTSLRDAATALRRHDVSFASVGVGDAIDGVISERDLVAAMARGDDLDTVTLDAIESDSLFWALATTTVDDVAREMLDASVRHILVCHPDGTLAGVVSMRDILAAVLD